MDSHLKMIERLNSVSPSFCLAKWVQVNLYLQTGQTHSCHHPTPHAIDPSMLDVNPSALHNTPMKLKSRSQMLKGERPAECEHCWNMEDIGEISDRTQKSSGDWAAPRFESIVKSGLGEREPPSYLEVSFDSVCNLKCAYCTPSNSTSWLQEIKQFGPYPTLGRFNDLTGLQAQGALPIPPNEHNPFTEAFWKWWPEVSAQLNAFRITGGEPLLSPHTWLFFDRVSEVAQPWMDLTVNSNLAVPFSLIEKLSTQLNRIHGQVKSLSLCVSMDTHGAAAEYIRYGLNYEQFLANTGRVLAEVHKRLSLQFMMTVSAMSTPGTKKFLQDVAELKNAYPHHDISVSPSYLRHPSFMSVRVLPAESAAYLENAITYMENNKFAKSEMDGLRRIVKWMKLSQLEPGSLKKERADFHRMFFEYDRRRGTDFTSTFPELSKFWRQCERARYDLDHIEK